MLNKDQVDFLLALLNSVNLPGQTIDLAYQTKQALIAAKVELAQKQTS